MSRVKFGVYLSTEHPAGADASQKFNELAEQVQLLEKVGFMSIWAGEHHVSGDVCFPPFITLASIARLTKRMTIGTGVTVLPLYHPVHLAEDVAMLDVISGGRVVLGVGSGYRKEEFDAFGVPFKNRIGRMEEEILQLRRLWTEERTTDRGRYLSLNDIRVSPKPIQKKLPIWIGVSGAAPDKALDRIARLGDAWILDAATPLSTYKERLPRYLRAWRKYHGRTNVPEFPMIRDLYIAEDSDEAGKDVGETLTQKYRTYHRWGYAMVRKAFRSEGDVTLVSLRHIVIVGSPDDCIGQIERYSKAGANHFIFRIQVGGLAHSKVMAMVKLFGRKVIPYFKDGGKSS